MVGDGEEDGGAVGAAAELAEGMKTQFDSILENLRNWFSGEGGYSAIMDESIQKSEKLYTTVNNLITAYSSLNGIEIETPDLSGITGAFTALANSINGAVNALDRLFGDGDTVEIRRKFGNGQKGGNDYNRVTD